MPIRHWLRIGIIGVLVGAWRIVAMPSSFVTSPDPVQTRFVVSTPVVSTPVVSTGAITPQTAPLLVEAARFGRGAYRAHADHPVSGRAIATDLGVWLSPTDPNDLAWEEGEETAPRLLAIEAGAHSVAFSPDGSRLAIGGGDGAIVLVALRETDLPPTQTLRAHLYPVTALAFEGDGSLLRARDQSGVVRLWDAVSGADLGARAAQPDDPPTPTPMQEPPPGFARGRGALLLRVTPTRAIACYDDGSARTWALAVEAEAGNPVDVSECAAESAPAGEATSSTGWRATGGRDGIIRLVDPSGDAMQLRGHVRRVGSVAFSAEGDLLASAGDDGQVFVWAVGAAEAPLVRLTGHVGGVADVTFTPDGGALVTLGYDGTLRVWRVTSSSEPFA